MRIAQIFYKEWQSASDDDWKPTANVSSILTRAGERWNRAGATTSTDSINSFGRRYSAVEPFE